MKWILEIVHRRACMGLCICCVVTVGGSLLYLVCHTFTLLHGTKGQTLHLTIALIKGPEGEIKPVDTLWGLDCLPLHSIYIQHYGL